MAQKFNVEILVHHLSIGDEMYKKGQVVTFPADVVKHVGRSVKILIEIPEIKTQRTNSTPSASTGSNVSNALNISSASNASTASSATSTKNEEKTTKTEDKK